MKANAVSRMALILATVALAGCARSTGDAAQQETVSLPPQLQAGSLPGMASPSAMPSVDDDSISGLTESESRETGEESSAVGADAAIGSVTAGERAFLMAMIPHHQQAVDMAALALTRAKKPAVSELASRILTSQAREIALMRTWLGLAAGGGMHGPEMHHHGAAGAEMPEHDAAAMGMADAATMRAMAKATGSTFDSLFLASMIAHHQGAVEMAADHQRSSNSTLARFATSIVRQQTSEISLMKALVK